MKTIKKASNTYWSFIKRERKTWQKITDFIGRTLTVIGIIRIIFMLIIFIIAVIIRYSGILD